MSEPRFPQRQQKTRPATTATRTRPHNDSKNRFPSVRVGKSVFFAVVAFLLSSRGAFFLLSLWGRVFLCCGARGVLFLLSLRLPRCCSYSPGSATTAKKTVAGDRNDSKQKNTLIGVLGYGFRVYRFRGLGFVDLGFLGSGFRV